MAATAVAQPLPTTTAPAHELLLEVEINGQRVADSALMLRTADGRFHARAGSLRAWRLRITDASADLRDDQRWLPLDALPGLRTRFDASRQRLSIDVPPEAFEASTLAAPHNGRPAPAEPSPGGFFNYGLVATRASGDDSYGAQIEAGVFSRHGVVVAGALAQHNDAARNAIRLDTTYTRDFPGRLETLRIGDTVSVAGAWGRPLRMGGVQWSTNFALQPGFVYFPTFTARGAAALPSTIDVFVNNARVVQQPVPPGPFSITNIPTVSGAGEVQLVVRDLLGREVTITQPFYGTQELLREGLSHYSIEIGAEREQYGVESFAYGDALASGTWRHGVSDRVTAEVHGEVMRDLVALGSSVDLMLPAVGVVNGTLAASEAKQGSTGLLAGLGFSRHSRELGVTLRTRWTSTDWRQAGASALAPVPRLENAASIGASLARFGSFNLAYVDQRYRQRPANEYASATWTLPLLRGASLGVTALRNFTERSNAFSVLVTVPFGPQETASLGQFWQRGGSGADLDYTQLNVQRGLPLGEGWGYRVYARSETDVQAAVSFQTAHGTYSAEATRFDGGSGMRLSASGGLGMLGGHVFASREITESFGVVKVDDYDGVAILLDNQPAARTSRGGYAVLPRLRAYDVNRIGIAQQDLPLDASIARLKIEAVPYFRSGVLIDFPVRRSRGATLRLVQENSVAVPPGASVAVDGTVFPVGQDGETYLTGLAARNRVVAHWRDGQCAVEVPYAPTADPLPDLGTFVCKRVAR